MTVPALGEWKPEVRDHSTTQTDSGNVNSHRETDDTDADEDNIKQIKCEWMIKLWEATG